MARPDQHDGARRVPAYSAEWRTADMNAWLLIGHDDDRDELAKLVKEWRVKYPDHFTRVLSKHVIEFDMPAGPAR